MGTITQDFRFALRRLRGDGGFTLGVMAMLALGLAASIAMFSVLRGVVLSALPYPDAERVVSVGTANLQQDVEQGRLTGAEAFELEQAKDVLEEFGFYSWNGITIVEGGEPREITVNWVSAGFFPALGVKPLHGRWINADDITQGRNAVVLSYTEWQRLFGGDPAAVGRSIDSDNGMVEVVGVMPPEFAFPWSGIGAWQPYAAANVDRSRPAFWQARFIEGVGRLAPGLSPTQVEERLAAAETRAREAHGLRDNGWRMTARPVLEEMVAGVRPVLWGAFAIALLVLLIACTNSAILLNARLIARTRELAISQALGAGMSRLRRILAFELGVLVLGAAGLAVLAIAIVLDRFRAFAADSLPRADAIVVDTSVIAFAAVAGAFALGLIVLQGWRIGAKPADALRAAGTGFGSRAATRRRRLLPAIGIALSTIAVACAVALALSLVAMQSVQPGFRTDKVFVVQIFRDGGPAQWSTFAENVLERLRALPGVEHAAISTAMPMSGIGSYRVDVEVPGRDAEATLQANLRRVSADYLSLLEIPVVAGRGIAISDREGTEPVAVVSRALAKRLFGDASPLDRSVMLNLGSKGPVSHRIVGVTEDTRNDTLRTAPQPELLVPYLQSPWVGMSFIVRGEKLDIGALKSVQAAVWSVDPREGITRAFPLEEDVQAQLAPSRFFATTIGLFALASLLLGALGVYAVTAFVQRQRTPEYGLKLAIGAPPRAMAAEIIAETARVAGVGLFVGLAIAWLALRFLASQLFETGAADPEAYAAAAVVIAITALLAGAAPAWRAARIDPMRALRNE